MKKIIFMLLFMIAAASGCREEKIENSLPELFNNNFGIEAEISDTGYLKERVAEYAGVSSSSIYGNISVKFDSDRVKLGGFESAFEAGSFAFRLFLDSAITGYEITSGDSAIYDVYSNFSFIGKYLNDRPGLYSLNLISKKYKLVWSRWGKKIMDINFNEDWNTAFIKTVLGWGSKGGFPFVVDARIYYYKKSENQLEEIENLGKGIRITSYWEDSSAYKVIFNYLDSLNSDTIFSRSMLFSSAGKKILDTLLSVNLVEEGFPVVNAPGISMLSPWENYRIAIDTQEGATILYLEESKNGGRTYLTGMDMPVRSFGWSEDDEYLFIAADNSESYYSGGADDIHSLLFIIDTRSKSITRVFDGSGYKNFVIYGPLLIFDDGFDDYAYITFYDFKRDDIYLELRINGGCGIRNLPEKLNP